MYIKRQFLSFAVVLAFQFIYADPFIGKEYCKKEGIELCDPNNATGMRRSRWWPPADEEDYDRVCLFFADSNYSFCILSHARTCYPPYHLTYLERYYSSYVNICNVDLPVYQVIKSSAKCMRKAWHEGKCNKIYKQAQREMIRYKYNEKYATFVRNENISALEFHAVATGLLYHLKKGCEIKHARTCGNDTVRYFIEGLEALQFYNYDTAIFYIDEYLPIAENLLEDLNFKPRWKNIIKKNIKFQRERVIYNPIPEHIEEFLGKTVET